MSKQRRLLLGLIAAAGGATAAAAVPLAVAHADDCALGDCTLVSGGGPTDVVYSGFRPFLTDWQQHQLVNVEVTQPDSSFVSGSYDVSEQDFSSAVMDNSIYQFGTFTPAATNTSGIDSEGLSGASVYDFTVGPGAGVTASGQSTYLLNDLSVFYANGGHTEVTTIPGDFTNYLEVTSTGSGDWIEFAGQSSPTLVWDSLNGSAFPATYFGDLVQNVLPPDSWFPDIYSMWPPELL